MFSLAYIQGRASKKSVIQMVVIGIVSLAEGSAYAAVVDNPGEIHFSSNADSHIDPVAGLHIYTQSGSIVGDLDAAGDIKIDSTDISFNSYQDANGWRTRVEAVTDGVGTYCSNSDHATVTFDVQIKVDRINGFGITPCYISLGTVLLTTGSQGGLTGADFNEASPMMVNGDITMSSTITGGCSTIQKGQIKSYYGLNSGPTSVTWELFDMTVNPTNFTGPGC